VFISVSLLWIPGRSDIPGNETAADQVAKQATSQDFVGPEHVLGIPTEMVRSPTMGQSTTAERQTRVSFPSSTDVS